MTIQKLHFSLPLNLPMAYATQDSLFLGMYFINDINFPKDFSYLEVPWTPSLGFLFLFSLSDNTLEGNCFIDLNISFMSLDESQEYKAVFLERECMFIFIPHDKMFQASALGVNR